MNFPFIFRLFSNPANVQAVPVADRDLCACGHDGFDNHDMRSTPPKCFNCACGTEPWDEPVGEPVFNPTTEDIWDAEPAHQFLCPCVRCTNKRVTWSCSKDLTNTF